jgi:hypothetical protein
MRTSFDTTQCRNNKGTRLAGIAGQVMHLPFLRELGDRYEITTLYHVSPWLIGVTPIAEAGRGPVCTPRLC